MENGSIIEALNLHNKPAKIKDFIITKVRQITTRLRLMYYLKWWLYMNQIQILNW